nr:hypothetical protein [Cupriavidus sp. LEh25]
MHLALVTEAAEQGVSLNLLGSARLTGRHSCAVLL